MRYGVVITFGTFDLLHRGHLALLERAASLGGSLVVGVSTDALSRAKKGRDPVYPQDDRARALRALRFVDDVFFEESLQQKAEYLRHWQADCLVMGDDWIGRFDDLVPGCDTVYLPRTRGISTTKVVRQIVSADYEPPSHLEAPP